MSLNICAIQGRLCKKPELKTTPNGVSVCSVSVAVERDYKSSGGERLTDFLTIVAWRGTAEFLCRYFSKGQQIAVSGSIQARQYQDSDGNTRTVTEIVANSVYFCGSKENTQQDKTTFQQQNLPPQSVQQAYSSGDFDEMTDDEDLPF